MDRLKRIIAKPSRYMTTSSDEASKRKKTAPIGDIQDDVNDIRNTLENDSNNYENFIPSNNNTNNTNTLFRSYTQQHVLPCTNTYTHTTHSDTDTNTYTNIQSYTNIQPHTNSEPHTNFQTYTNIQPYTTIHPQTDFQTYTNTSTNTDSTNLLHASVIHNYTPQVTNERATYNINNTSTEFQSISEARTSTKNNLYRPAEETRLLTLLKGRENIPPQSEKTDNR